jgi:serine/threonine-protein kinase
MTAPEYGNLSARVEPETKSPAHNAVDLPLLARNGFHYGEQIGGKYRVTGLIGEGGMGIVLSAVHDDLERDVAIKVVRRELLQNEDVIERLLAEAQIAACIRSEHVTRVLDVGRLTNGSPYLVLEKLEGRDLSGILDEGGPLDTETAVDFVLQVCDALAEAHAGGIVHRDLKPENLFFTTRPDGSPCIKVLDFGISKNLGARDRRAAITNPSQVMGSPFYMAPEQIRSKPVDPRSDVWALGVVLYELCTGQTPFAADSVPSVCHLVLNEKPTPPRTFAPDLPLALEGIILRCLEKDADHRFANVAELASVLAAFGGPEAAYYADRVERVLRVGPGATGSKVTTTDRRQRHPSRGPDVRVVVDDSRPDLKTQPSAAFPRSYPGPRPSLRQGKGAAFAPGSAKKPSFSRPAIYVGLAVGIALGAGIALGSTQAASSPAMSPEIELAAVVPAAGAALTPTAPIVFPSDQTPVLTSTITVEELSSSPVEKPARAASSARHRADAWDRRNFGGRR